MQRASQHIHYRATLWLLLIGVITVLPAVLVLLELVTRPEITLQVVQSELPRWVYLLLMVGFLHAAYAVYVIQFHTPVVFKVISILAVVLAALFALLGGWLMFAGPHSSVSLWLQLREVRQVQAAQVTPAAAWCLVLTAIEMALSVRAHEWAYHALPPPRHAW